ncbi:(Fe-S)-binding protein [Paenibacillus sp. P25]|nr:(Fe-S)-binding protein [Paenibacillus sp. P25]
MNLWFRRKEPPGRLKKLDLEDESAESFGAGRIEDFTQKQMLDFYACVECGRCTNVCPASNTGKALSPMHLIVKLRDHLIDKGAPLQANRRGCRHTSSRRRDACMRFREKRLSCGGRRMR